MNAGILPGMWLAYVVTLHCRKLIFPFPRSVTCYRGEMELSTLITVNPAIYNRDHPRYTGATVA